MKIAFMAGALAFSAFATPSFAQTPVPAADFAMKASVGNTFEVEESKLALKQAKSPKIKSFAKMMIQDHTLAEKKLMAAAKSSGGTVEMKLDDPHQAMVTALSSKTGADFDKAYTADQIQGHQETASLLTDYESSGDDAKLKTWAKATLPKVQMHLKRIQAISSTMTSSM
jgi:putative membrane protein